MNWVLLTIQYRCYLKIEVLGTCIYGNCSSLGLMAVQHSFFGSLPLYRLTVYNLYKEKARWPFSLKMACNVCYLLLRWRDGSSNCVGGLYYIDARTWPQ